MNLFNFHTHTFYCDGKANPEAFIIEAIRKEMTAIGFSSHSPLPSENNYSIHKDKLPAYKRELTDLQKKYGDKINIFIALEFDYIPGISDDFGNLTRQFELDYAIGSVHLVKNLHSEKLWFIDGPEANYAKGIAEIFDNDAKKAVTTYFEQLCEMIRIQKPDIIGHIDKVKMHNKNRFFSEEEQWYKKLITKTLKTALSSGSIIEVNTRGIYRKLSESLYPGIDVLKEIFQMGIPITISSDAHHPDELTAYFPETLAILKNIGFQSVKSFNGKNWVNIPLK